jgi:hypothetical protein
MRYFSSRARVPGSLNFSANDATVRSSFDQRRAPDLDTLESLEYENRMRQPSSAIVLAGLVALAGCGPSATEQALILKQSAPYRQRGSSSITGRAFLLAPDGRQIPASAEDVYLTPVTTWAESRLPEALAQNEIPAGDDRSAQIWWTSRADAAGRFSFSGLPPGEYYVITSISYASGGVAKESVANARVRVGPGQTAETEVTRRIENK